ncbi:hypothetical protein ECMP0209801_5211 [Escherichia coli MP020980.1]|nr:hypothetical protein ECMP0209801_5211 [Escherichia coli MP020980.1]
MGSCAAPSVKGDDKFITTDYLQQCLANKLARTVWAIAAYGRKYDKNHVSIRPY